MDSELSGTGNRLESDLALKGAGDRDLRYPPLIHGRLARLVRHRTLNPFYVGAKPTSSSINKVEYGHVAQLDSARGFYPLGCGFESYHARQ